MKEQIIKKETITLTPKEKREKTMMEKYGVKNISQLPSIKEKKKQTCLKNHGVTSGLANVAKREETMMKKYGVTNPAKLEEVKEKKKQTCLEKYGTEHHMQNPEFMESFKQAFNEKYGVENPQQLPEIKEKTMRTNVERYGTFNLQKAEVRKKAMSNNSWTRHLSQETLNILQDKNLFEKFLTENADKSINQLATLLGVRAFPIYTYSDKYGLRHLISNSNTAEREIKDFLAGLGIIVEKTRKIIAPQEIDLYSEEHKIGIEFNGTYWHSDLVRPNSKYHYNKTKAAEDVGVFLFHINEHEWYFNQDLIKKRLKALFNIFSTKVYARNCQIKEVTNQDRKTFLNDNHLQGNVGASVNLGLYYKEELVSIMTFGKPRFNKKYEWELIRFCNKSDTIVTGGASKLFKHFIKNYKGNIISYSNIAKTKGNLYKQLGFNYLKETPPNYVWVKGADIFTRYQTQMVDEDKVMREKGFYKIYDCGNKIWEYLN